MANNHNQFVAFNDLIKANQSQVKTLRQNRDAVRNKIRKYYKENYPDDVQPTFHMQGSFAMKTILNSIRNTDNSGTYDLDDGIYFISNNENDKLSIEDYHSRILKAIEGHTKTGEEDNNPCVTILYADGHHLDLPIYFWNREYSEHPQLAHKKEGWIDTDPKEFYKWFNGRGEHPQLRRIVRYLKAWCEFIRSDKGKKMPTGCILTILVVKHFVADDRDDIALQKVLTAIYNEISAEGGFHCYRPTYPINEDLFESFSNTKKENFLTELKLFKSDAEKAIACKNPKDSCVKWQKYFGDRFCCTTAKDEDEDAEKKESSGTLNTNSRFA